MIASCTFCKIVRGELVGHTVYEDDRGLAFLDHRPLFPGHCLLIPKRHYETLVDLPEDWILPLFSAARLIARALEVGLKAQGSFVAINNRISQSVPHLHIHLVPRRRKDGLKGFFWPRHPYPSPENLREVQNLLRTTIDRLRVDGKTG